MKIVNIIAGGLFILASSVASASHHSSHHADKAHDGKNWTCSTNASTGSSESEKRADDKMAKGHSSAKEAFSYAAKHCRDCTKITCEVQASETPAQ